LCAQIQRDPGFLTAPRDRGEYTNTVHIKRAPLPESQRDASTRNATSSTVGDIRPAVIGGEPTESAEERLRNLISSETLDDIIEPYLKEHYFHATFLYNVRTKPHTAPEAARMIRHAVRMHGWVMAPAHTRNHWATAIFAYNENNHHGVVSYIFDSAPSPMTFRDWDKLIASMGFAAPFKSAHAIQPRGSNECGLHVIWIASMQSRDSRRPFLPPATGDRVSLRELRSVLVPTIGTGLNPAVAALIDKSITTEGAGRDTHARLSNNRLMCHANACVQALAKCYYVGDVADDSVTAQVLRDLSDDSKSPTQLPEDLRVGEGVQDALEAMDHIVKLSPSLRDMTSIVGTDGDQDCMCNALLVSPARSVSDAIAAFNQFVICEPLPRVLIVGVERGTSDRGSVKARMHADKFVQLLGAQYKLRSAVVHTGAGNDDGHFVALVRDVSNWDWRVVDDTRTYPPRGDIDISVASILIYEKVPPHIRTDASCGQSPPIAPTECIVVTDPPADEHETITVSDTDAESTPACGADADALRANRKKAVRANSFVADNVISAYVKAMRTHMRANTLVLDSQETECLIRAQRRSYYHPDEWEKKLKSLKRRARDAATIAFIVHHNNHYLCAIAERSTAKICVYDSMIDYHTKTRKNIATTLARVVEQAFEDLRTFEVEVQDHMRQQSAGSNDCALFALSTAWFGGVPSAVLTREQLVNEVMLARRESRTRSTPDTTSRSIRWSFQPLHVSAEHPIGHAHVRKAMKHLSRGDIVVVNFTEKGGERCEWLGKVTVGGNTPCTAARVSFSQSRCPLCGEWHALDDEHKTLMYPVPFGEHEYFEITQVESIEPTVVQCHRHDDECQSIDSESDDEGEAEPTSCVQTMPKPESAPIIGKRQISLTKEMPKEALEARHPLRALPTNDPLLTTGAIAQKWFIHKGKPMDVHAVVWKRLAESTRNAHRREIYHIKHMDPQTATLPFAKAVVQSVMKRADARNWAWSTTSATLSTVATALKSLPLYTTCTTGIDLRADPYYIDALRTAQRLARSTAIKPKKSEALAFEQFESVRQQLKRPGAVSLLNLAWFLAARVGDARQIAAENLTIHEAQAGDDAIGVRIQALFTKGKGASFWGPYTIQGYVPTSVAKRLLEHKRSAPTPQSELFTKADQAEISAVVNAIEGCSLRSIRRGALVFFSQCGATDENIQMLSGHKRKDTLMRYLGWGHHSSEAAKAARARAVLANAKHVTAGEAAQMNRHPMHMGQWSGVCGKQGKRIASPPQLFPYKPPSGAELGIRQRQETAHWPLKLNRVSLVDWDALERLVEDPELLHNVRLARSWVTTADNFGVTWPPMVSTQIPYSNFTASQILEIMDYGKLVPWPEDAPIRCYAKGFPTPQFSSEQLRPVWEPANNAAIDRDALSSLGYPSRLEGRQGIARCTYFIDFDYRAYFDEFGVNPELYPYYVIRVREPVPVTVNGETKFYHTFALTREPMGATHSAHVAQTFTWAVCEPLIRDKEVFVRTMIDNVGIGSNDAEAFVAAVRTFLERSDKVGATIKGRENIPSTAEGILAAGRAGAKGPTTFLGETWADGLVRNSDSNVQKLSQAFDRLRSAIDDPMNRSPTVVTRRQVAALISLATWMASTIDIPMNRYYPLIRTYSDLARQPGKWDERARVDATLVNNVGKLVGPLIENNPVRPMVLRPASARNEDYDVIAIVDASASGFGAFVSIRGEVYELRSGFSKEIPHSAWAEPEAAKRVVQWIRIQCPDGNLAVVSDHAALTSGQRRWWSGHGGVSTAYHINAFFEALYQGDAAKRADVFYVKGEENPADAPSRANRVGDPLRFKRSDFTIPPLASFQNGIVPPQRPWWHV